MISTQDIKNKEIINIFDGKSLGYVSDIEINLEKGRVEAIIVPAQAGFFNFFSKESEYIIKWKDIKKIGEDVILVEVKNIYYSDSEESEIENYEIDLDED